MSLSLLGSLVRMGMMTGRGAIGATRIAGRGARATGRGVAALGRGAVGLAKTAMVAKLASSMAKVDENELNTVTTDANTLGESYETPVKKSEITKVNVSDAILKFTEYVNKETADVRMVRAIGKPLPELTVSRKYSPIMKDIIENINGIKKRLESVELKTHKQTAILLRLRAASMGLNDTVKEAIDTDRQNELQLKRDIDEEQIERKGIGNVARNVFGKLRDYAENTGNLLKEYISKFGLPLALLAAPGLIPEDVPGVDPDMTLDDVLSNIRDTTKSITPMTSATLGATAGARSRAARIVSSFSGRRQNLQALQAMRTAREYFSDLRNSQSRIAQQLGRAATTMPRSIQRALNIALKTPARLFAGMVAIESMMLIIEFYASGLMSEQERDKRMKEKITELVNVIGMPWLLAFVFGAIGTKATLFGTFIGAIAGFLAGVLLADSASEIFSTQRQVDALYDAFVHGNWSKLKSVYAEIAAAVPGIVGQKIDELSKAVVQRIDTMLTPTMATEEQIRTRFGAGASAADILFRSSAEGREGSTIGFTDESAILYAFKDVDTPEKYHNIKKKFEEEFLPKYNKVVGDKNSIDTMEEYLDRELSTNEYDIVKDNLRIQVLNNDAVSEEEYNQFIRDIDYDTRIRMTAEEYNLIRQGKAVTVNVPGSGVEVMTEEEIQQAENITREVKEEALNRLQNNRSNIDNSNITPSQSTNSTNVIALPPARGMSGPMTSIPTNYQHVSPSSPTPNISTTDPFINVSYVT